MSNVDILLTILIVGLAHIWPTRLLTGHLSLLGYWVSPPGWHERYLDGGRINQALRRQGSPVASKLAEGLECPLCANFWGALAATAFYSYLIEFLSAPEFFVVVAGSWALSNWVVSR